MRLGKNLGWWFISVVCFLLSACLSQVSNTATVAVRETGGETESVSSVIWVKTLVRGLSQPWGMDFLPDGNILVTEKPGGLKRITTNNYAMQDIKGLPETADAGQGGLLDILVHPNFASNGLIYLSYTVEEKQLYSTRVMRAKLENNQLVDKQVLFTAQPFYQERRHFGSRLLLDEGYLYITVGDRGHRDLAQSLQTHNGKVIRLRENGTVPEDNPFVARVGAQPEIWTYGHRNPQGIARNPLTGAIWVSEHGPQGGDEINELHRAANYGWPLVTYGEEYGGGKIGIGAQLAGTVQPLTYYVPSIGTGGMDFYVGDKYSFWQNSLLVSGLHSSQISRVALKGDGIEQKTRLQMDMRVRDLQVGPDGFIYALADGSRLVRLETEKP
ncbi:MAG: glucose/arabinose dehydrogenase [Halioglobus sp.]|jgi:glucose/arabinose dehydrogenase